MTDSPNHHGHHIMGKTLSHDEALEMVLNDLGHGYIDNTTQVPPHSISAAPGDEGKGPFVPDIVKPSDGSEYIGEVKTGRLIEYNAQIRAFINAGSARFEVFVDNGATLGIQLQQAVDNGELILTRKNFWNQ